MQITQENVIGMTDLITVLLFIPCVLWLGAWGVAVAFIPGWLINIYLLRILERG